MRSIVGEAMHVQQLDAAVARGEQRALEQHRADAMALPGLLDREGGFGFANARPIGRNSALPRRTPSTKKP